MKNCLILSLVLCLLMQTSSGLARKKPLIETSTSCAEDICIVLLTVSTMGPHELTKAQVTNLNGRVLTSYCQKQQCTLLLRIAKQNQHLIIKIRDENKVDSNFSYDYQVPSYYLK